MENKFRFSKNLRNVLRAKDMKPRDLKMALKAIKVNIADPTLSNYLSESETNVRTPKLGTILNIATALNVSTGELLGEDFLAHDASVNNMILCDEVSYSKSLGLGANVELFTVKDNSIDIFRTGDRLVIDKSEHQVTAGFYVGELNGKNQVLNVSNNGSAYTINFSGNPVTVEYDKLKVTGKVVAKFTTQI